MDKLFSDINDAIDRFNNAQKDELLLYLDGSDEILIQIALLNINDINSQTEAEKITEKLTEHSSETREYCAFLINRLMKNTSYRKFFSGT